MNKQEILNRLPETVLITGDAMSLEVTVGGEFLNVKPTQKVWNHANEFNWGYGGSGPAQLSLAILLKYLNKEDAVSLHQDFKFKVVAGWPGGKDFEVNLPLREKIAEIIALKPSKY